MKKLLLFLSLFALLTGCSNTKLTKTNNFLGYFSDLNGNMVLALNTECYLTTVNPKYNDTMVDKAKEIIFKYHKLLDSHHIYENIDNIYLLNKNRTIIDETGIISDALEYAINMSILTDGYFNPTIGKVSNLYEGKFVNFDAILNDPDKRDIDDALKTVVKYNELKDYIKIDRNNKTISLLKYNDNDFIIDLGAISKGYILDAVYKELVKFNTSFIITAGSSSIATYKAQNEEISWNIGQSNLDKSPGQIFAYHANNLAISTSGDNEQYYLLEDGTRRSHILNPDTGYSSNYYRAVTLICLDTAYNGLLDALSTALFNIEDIDKINEIINKSEIQFNTSIDYALIDDNHLYMTNNFKDILIEQYSSPNYTFEWESK